MNVTDYLVEKSNGLLKIEPEMLNYGNSYSAFNSASPEVEVCEFLNAMVRILKPQVILETGTAVGVSCSFMAQGLKENGFGKITTIEYNAELIKKSEELWQKLELTNWIKPKQGLSYNFHPDEDYDLIFLDTEPQIRFKELELFYPFLKEGGYAFIHDLNYDMSQNTHNPDHPEVDPWPFSKFSDILTEYVKTDKLRIFHLPNPRGMTGFYKTKAEEYRP